MDKRFLLLLFCAIFSLLGQLSAVVFWDDSSYNWENSQQNWNNSPKNWNNSRVNINSSGIYDSQGNRTGYMVKKDNGDINMFNNNGKRTGYIKRK